MRLESMLKPTSVLDKIGHRRFVIGVCVGEGCGLLADG